MARVEWVLDRPGRPRGRRFGVELKYGDAPKVTRSMRVAIEDLGLEHVFVVHPGESSFVLAERIDAVSVRHLEDRLASRITDRP